MPTTNLGLTIINQSDYISPNPINDNMEKLDALGVDYVVAQGDSGVWRYRRWKSGTYECWCYGQAQQVAPTTGNIAQMHVNYPVTFITFPVVNINVRTDASPSTAVGYIERSQQYAEWWIFNLYKTADVDFYIYACGQLK